MTEGECMKKLNLSCSGTSHSQKSTHYIVLTICHKHVLKKPCHLQRDNPISSISMGIPFTSFSLSVLKPPVH